MRIISWNVNGIRACVKKGFIDFMKSKNPDILCVQEVKAKEEQIPKELTEYLNRAGYNYDWHAADRPGYSGVATFYKKSIEQPTEVIHHIGDEGIDCEGRILEHKFKDFNLYNIYYPNGQSREERLDYKMDFYDKILKRWKKEMKKGENILAGGDVNTAHKTFDLARPKANEKISGFLPKEREWIDNLLDKDKFIDTFRMINGDVVDEYSWWSYRAGARPNNVGWRIDYFFASEELKSKVKDAFIWQDIEGSDHCPVGVKIG
jgi:exodeoxyribonuclease-3